MYYHIICKGITSLFDLGPWKELLMAQVNVKFKKPSVFNNLSELFNR